MASYKDNYGKYYCKYCDLTLARNAASIAQHEQGNRHRRNVERYLRTVGRSHGPDDRETVRELRRIEAATGLRLTTPHPRPAPSNPSGASSMPPPLPPPPPPLPEVPVPFADDDAADDETLVRRGVAAPMPGEWTVVEAVPSAEEDAEGDGEGEAPAAATEETPGDSGEPAAKAARLEWRDQDSSDSNSVTSVVETGLRVILSKEDAADEVAEAPLPPVAAFGGAAGDSSSDEDDKGNDKEEDVMALFKRKGRAAGRCTRRTRAAPSDSDSDSD